MRTYGISALIAACSAVVATPAATKSAQVAPNATNETADAYVGAQACATCHSQVHDSWKSGRHSKMLQPANGATVKGDFTKGSIALRGSRYTLRARNGEYFITESDLSGKAQEHRIEYTLGSRRVQHYLTTIDKGRIVVLAPTWDVQRAQWFHNVEIIRPDEDDRQVVQQWNKNCVGCHVSRQDNAYDPRTQVYQTRWMDFGTSCERCHGPGRAHVEKYGRLTQSTQSAQNKELSADSAAAAPAKPKLDTSSASEGWLIVRPTRLDPAASSAICGQCHSLRTVVNPEYKAGEAFSDYFVPVLEYVPVAAHSSQDPPYWADGRPRRFSNDAIGLWQSGCFLRGGATCTTCHINPHLPDVDRNPQLAPTSSNALCTKCHQEIGARLTIHSRHGADSPGSSCVECHMPRTVVSIKSTMRDHTISVPAPENTVRFGIPNACTECHIDKRAAWAVDVLRSWWPDGRRRQLIAQAEAFSAARAGRGDASAQLIAISEDDHYAPLTRANAVGYLRTYADPRAVAALVRAAKSDDPAIRATAIVGLGESGRGNQAAHDALVDALGDPARTVRIGSLLGLLNQGGEALPPGEFQRFRHVGDEFVAWARMNQQNADLQRAEGIIHLLDGDFNRAADSLEISTNLDPGNGSATFFLALARVGQRRYDEARALLQAVPRLDPHYERAQEQLKKLR